ncbi:hypothetical protein FDP22_18725 (plasmid) [Paroceanicella profunda]|uniref:Uncharacterized protein n=1 Tax=Paroceanicella profunda TaxID=2579971 RepID=A0A5B8FZM4_9RHOB|nr:hypothetical protein [Paroceanicella profunda]QDL93915.1 hypothetical protein FDP22_18725 [Paroceanicella profunda]
MIELIFVACLQSSPSVCEQKAVQYVEPISPLACAMGAQPELAKWVESHPGWSISQWKCQSVRDREIHI